MIDPSLYPLPLQDIHETLDLLGHKPTPKKGGRRVPASPIHEGQGNARASEGPTRKRATYDSRSEAEAFTRRLKRGRIKGSTSFRTSDLAHLIKIAEEILLTGGKGWQVIGARHRAWALDHDMPIRSDKSLDNKFKHVQIFLAYSYGLPDYHTQLLRKPKPTGSGTCPPDIERAYFIADLI